MQNTNVSFNSQIRSYIDKINEIFAPSISKKIEILSNDLLCAWKNKQNVFICGNGGSAANAIHIANDFHYGIGACGSPPQIPGLRVEALPANSGIITCLANDTGYENIYSHQLEVKSTADDILIVLSGSGNSPNIINALRLAQQKKLRTHAIVAFDGGKCKEIAENAIHFPIYDMQIAEDTQMIVGHICMQWLNKNKPTEL